MASKLVSWRSLTLTGGLTYGEREIDPESQTGLAVLREYRRTGAIRDVWLASEADLAAADARGEDSADLGPAVEEIDWTGFPAGGAP